jgi:hypothetical protein
MSHLASYSGGRQGGQGRGGGQGGCWHGPGPESNLMTLLCSGYAEKTGALTTPTKLTYYWAVFPIPVQNNADLKGHYQEESVSNKHTGMFLIASQKVAAFKTLFFIVYQFKKLYLPGIMCWAIRSCSFLAFCQGPGGAKNRAKMFYWLRGHLHIIFTPAGARFGPNLP